MRATENENGNPVSNQETDEGGELDFSTFMDSLVDDVKGYAHAQKQYLTLHVSEKVGTLMGKAVGTCVVYGVLGVSLLFFSVALAFYLGDLLSSVPLGFVIVAGFHLLLLGVFMLWWKQGARDRFIVGRINDLNDDN
ncbi:MAG: phage holin family protein [Flavobacteriales bacterium]|nr:phage holin family protein [Flavobacteriales bacterium]